MCAVCDFYEQIQPSSKDSPAIGPNGTRTVWGYYHQGDATTLARFYPKVGKGLIDEIANLIHHPRLLEVMGAVEMVERYLEGTFSRIRNAGVQVAANPLSILFWSHKYERVMRVKTRETEMLHGPMEKLALRHGSMKGINELLNRRHGVQLTFGCSCCAIAVATSDIDVLFASQYYQKREGLGRYFDSDVLTVSNDLFEGISVDDVPPAILAATADFHDEEVTSYKRFSGAAYATLSENSFVPSCNSVQLQVRSFLIGEM